MHYDSSDEESMDNSNTDTNKIESDDSSLDLGLRLEALKRK
jgi:hypothetical protein